MSAYEQQSDRGVANKKSPILASAALSIAALMIATGLQYAQPSAPTGVLLQNREPIQAREYLSIEDSDANGIPDWQDELAKSGIALSSQEEPSSIGASTTDPLASITVGVAEKLYGGYLLLKKYDEYSPSRAEELANSVVSSIHAPSEYVPRTVNDLTIASSSDPVAYRARMQVAVAGMLTDDLPEIEYFGRYISTHDPSWLSNLENAALRYEEASSNVLLVSVPKEAAPEHLRVVNALGAYASTLHQIARAQPDAFAAAALVKGLNSGEQEVLVAFNALAQFYVRTAN